MSVLGSLIARDLRRLSRRGDWWLPPVFFTLVAALFPFAIGPDAPVLARAGGGAAWIAALLAALLPVERLFGADREDGTLDQLAVRGISDQLIALARMTALWLGFAPALLIALIPSGPLLALGSDTLMRLAIGLLIGTPGLAALATITAALTVTLRGASGVAALLMAPLAVPLLIFGAGALSDKGAGALAMLGAVSLFLVAIAPFAAGAALNAARD